MPIIAASTSAQPVPRYPVAAFFETASVVGASFAADGRAILVSANWSGVYNAWAVPTDGGDPVRLTWSTTDAVFAQAFFPADGRLLFTRDRGGDELTHLFVRELDGRERDLTPGAALKAGFGGWARDGEGFFVLTNERDARVFDLYELAADDYRRTLLFENDGGYDVRAVSPDRRYVALTRTRTPSDADVLLHDRVDRTTTCLTLHTGSVSNGVIDFDATGDALFLSSDEGSEFVYVVRHHLATGERTTVLEASWDVVDAAISPRGTYLVAAINEDGRSALRVVELETMRELAVAAPARAVITDVRFSDDERQLAFYASGGRAPRDLHVTSVGSATARRLTTSLGPAIDAARLVDARVVRFASHDGLEVPGLLYMPHEASSAAPVAALVMVHGGPGGQARVGWNPVVQCMVNHGYAVFDVNHRGSSGYGKTYYGLDDRRHGEADLADVLASRTMLVDSGLVDPARIGVMGGSYGGFLVLAALTTEPTAFAVGVDLFGPANWLRTLASLPVWLGARRDALYAEMGHPDTDAERLARISPLFHAHRICRPLLVLQGANDARVPKAESDEIVAAVRANGVAVEYVMFPDEGHGFARRANEIAGYTAVLAFLDAHLAGESPDASTDRSPGAEST